jgi:hypothetical protein
VPAARYWTLTAVTPDGKLLQTPSDRHGFTSSELLRKADGGFEIRVSPMARPGDWLQVNRDQTYLLMLRLYDTALSANAFSVLERSMPSILREQCR